jgi:hypothetical protein
MSRWHLRVDRGHTGVLWNALTASVVVLAGALLFMALEGWSFDDAFYFAAITGTTIGYGDHPDFTKNTDASLVAAAVYALVSINCVGVLVGAIGDIVNDLLDDGVLNMSSVPTSRHGLLAQARNHRGKHKARQDISGSGESWQGQGQGQGQGPGDGAARHGGTGRGTGRRAGRDGGGGKRSGRRRKG